MLAPWKKSYDQPRKHIKKKRCYFADKGLYSESYGFSSSHVWMWELDHKERWALKNWCLSTVVLEKTLETPLDCKEIKSVNYKGNQPWIFIGRTHAEAKAPIHWPPDAKSRLIREDPEGRRRMGPQRTRWLDGITDSIDVNLSKLREMVKDSEACCAYSPCVAKSRTQLSNWTTMTKVYFCILI